MPILDLTGRKYAEEFNKLPVPTNERLLQLFDGVDKVVIQHCGVYNERAIGHDVVLTIDDANELRQFAKLLEIDEPKTVFCCMCLGDYAIELYANAERSATIGFHHGISIRYDKWQGDAELAQSDNLVVFLDKLGLTQPLADKLKAKEDMQEDKVAERNWLREAPRCFAKYKTATIPELIVELNEEIKDQEAQIIALLQAYGRAYSFWTSYPVYEQIASDILNTLAFDKIIEAYVRSDRNYKTRRGLGRYICYSEFKKIRQQKLAAIHVAVIEDLEKCFDQIGDKRGINEIFSLRVEKNKSLGLPPR